MNCVDGAQIHANDHPGTSIETEVGPLDELAEKVRYIKDLYIWMFDLSVLGWLM